MVVALTDVETERTAIFEKYGEMGLAGFANNL